MNKDEVEEILQLPASMFTIGHVRKLQDDRHALALFVQKVSEDSYLWAKEAKLILQRIGYT